MKKCPFCKEEIKDDAIKCKHCQTMLVTIGDRADQSNTVTYVVDQGLLRFGKFAGALLAVFLTIGVVLYGVDLKNMAAELEKRADELDSIDEKVKLALTEIASVEQNVDRTLATAKDAAARAEQFVKELDDLRGGVDLLTDTIVRETSFVSEGVQDRVGKLLEAIKALPDDTALALASRPPVPLDPKLQDLIRARDPSGLAATDPDAARQILLMIVTLMDRTDDVLTTWEEALMIR